MFIPSAFESADHVLSTFEQTIAAPLGEYGHGAHRSMPYSATKFHQIMKPLVPGKFLDVGCGLGSKLLQAQFFGWYATGLEIYEPYANYARQLCTDCEVITIDAFKFDKYDEYDLVYMWWPRVDDADQARLETYVEQHMRPGATIYFAESITGPDFRTVA